MIFCRLHRLTIVALIAVVFAGAPESLAQETGAQETAAQDTGAQDTGARDSAVEGSITGEGEAREFRFRFREGERFRILGINRQDVYLNDVLSHSAVIVTRVVEETVSVDESGAVLQGTYQVTEENLGSVRAYNLQKEYPARFGRNYRGEHRELEPGFMPVLRSFPTFPRGSVVPGESWSAEAYEVHDFRRGYEISEPYEFSMPVAYRYEGETTWDGEAAELISASYNIFHQGPDFPRSPYYPKVITGNSEQDLYWDRELGRVRYSEEEYTFLFVLNTGDRVEYRGRATYDLVEIPSLDRRALRRELEELARRAPLTGPADRSGPGASAAAPGNTTTPEPGAGDEGASRSAPEEEGFEVEEREEGVTIILKEVYFEPDSPRLTEGARETIAEISRVLGGVRENDILVTGHTALAGTPEGRETLSVERARRVAEAIVAGGSHREEQVLYRGMGARRPAASNATEEGRRKNRRVEITILE